MTRNSPPRQTLFPVATWLAGIFLVSVGCDEKGGGDFEIVEHRTLQQPRGTIGRVLTDDERFAPPKAPPPTNETGLVWDLPDGWFDRPLTENRIGNYGVEGHEELDCYLSMLPGEGGGLRGNVDRWRRQMGMGPIDDATLSALPTGTLLKRSAVRVDLAGTYTSMSGDSSENARMVGLIAEFPMMSLFLKMVGPADVVAAELKHFDQIASSIRFGAAPTPPPVASSEFSWKVPDGWTEGPPKPMREVTLESADSPGVECYVSVLGGDGGGVVGNLTRWAGQMGQPAPTADEIEALPRVVWLGEPAPIFECVGAYAGMGDEGVEGQMMIATLRTLEDRTVFVKMTGPREGVAAERERFIEFCRTLRR